MQCVVCIIKTAPHNGGYNHDVVQFASTIIFIVSKNTIRFNLFSTQTRIITPSMSG